jgi:hypothetical protein
MAAAGAAEQHENVAAPSVIAPAALQLKIRLLAISPMIWRRVLVAETLTLRELHGVSQVAMGWESLHLFLFERRGACYGSWELDAASPDVTLASLRLRRGSKLTYRYDMTDGWVHEIRVEERFDPPPATKRLPLCLDGAGACPPEDCGGPAGYLRRRDEARGFEAHLDVVLIADVLGALVDGAVPAALTDPDERAELEDAVERMRTRQPYLGTTFSRRRVNAALRADAHLERMHQWF